MGTGEYIRAHYTILAHAHVYHLYIDKYYLEQNGRIDITLSTYYFIPENPLYATH